MKKLIFLLVIIAVSSCKPKEVVVTSEQVQEIVDYLASDAIEGRDTGSDGIELSAQFLEKKFKEYGVKPYYETYRDNFKIDSINGFNVLGYLEGNDNTLKNEIIIIGAHYDHVGYRTKTVEGDSLANGANDNASGTAAVMAMADYFAKRKNNKRSVVFALFSGEERGLRGSRHMAQRMKSENVNLYTVVNFEMLGVPFTDRDYDAFVSGYDLSNMAEKINTYTNSNVIGKSEVSLKYNLFKRSDNYPFYEEFKIPSQTVSSCDLTNYDFYHHADDEADKMNYVHMASLINKLAPALEAMSNTATKEIAMNEIPADD
jgi:Zn-dependent M28 family amino/carboxypeptidase